MTHKQIRCYPLSLINYNYIRYPKYEATILSSGQLPYFHFIKQDFVEWIVKKTYKEASGTKGTQDFVSNYDTRIKKVDEGQTFKLEQKKSSQKEKASGEKRQYLVSLPEL